MVTNKDFEAAIKRIATCLGRTCGEMVRYRRKYHPFKGKLDWRARKGTVVCDNSAGGSIWLVFVANESGNTGPEIIRGTKRDIVNFSYAFCKAKYYMAKPRMKKLKSSRTGDAFGRLRR